MNLKRVEAEEWVSWGFTALVIFLPLSAWLVSESAKVSISLLRDAILVVILIAALKGKTFTYRHFKDSTLLKIVLLFGGWVVLSFLWREASFSQSLRGVRFILGPLVAFSLISLSKLPLKKYLSIIKAAGYGALAALLIGLLLLLFAKGSGVGSESIPGIVAIGQTIGGTQVVRFAATLAGPNALGLYLLALLPYLLWQLHQVKSTFNLILLIASLVALFLSFSRGALLGTVLFFASLFFMSSFAWKKTLFMIIGFICISASVAIYQDQPSFKKIIFHSDSGTLRLAQYQRVWQERQTIGWLGRGAGTAGPASQYRLDGGPNYWTENTYLDVFQEFGVIGLALYLSILGALLLTAFRVKSFVGRLFQASLLAYLLVSFTLNAWTGQAGAFLFWLGWGMWLRISELKREDNKDPE